jgi:HPt (histidine-containing phosphotransfer) domain-containing protein
MTNDLIDASVFEDLADAMGDDFAQELLLTFLGDAENMFGALNTALAETDSDSYRRAAHSIKSNAQTFGALALADQARTMELSETMSAEAVSGLSATYAATAAALRGLLND